jgi:hypothetical protein
MTPKGNSRANGISKRESNNEANCEADCNIARHNLAGAFSVGGDGDSRSRFEETGSIHGTLPAAISPKIDLSPSSLSGRIIFKPGPQGNAR